MTDFRVKSGSDERVLILGATGLLGSTLGPYLSAHGFEVIRHGQRKDAAFQVDLENREATGEMLQEIWPDVIINLVGFTNVDLCEERPNQAYRINVHIVENIVEWLQSHMSCHLIQISTDQVYDGVGPNEESEVTLKNYYGFSKYAGELVAACLPSTILRTNFIGKSHCEGRDSLTDWLYRSLSNQDDIQVFDDVMFNPLSMQTFSKIMALIIKDKPAGVFNLGSHGGMSKADFAYAFASGLNFSGKHMTRATSDKMAFLKAYRPKDMRMNVDRIEKTLGITLPGLDDEIGRVIGEYHV